MKLSSLTTKLKTRLKKALVVTATVLTAVAGANFTALPANAALSYDFTSWTFTPCGQTGRLGPTLAMCQTAYSSSTFASDSNYFYVDSQGQQWWKPPVSGNYHFEVAGAAGGGTNGGRGVVFQEQIALNATYWYCMGIGQKGVADTKSADSGGGGGGTYLGSSSTNTSGNCSNSAGVFAGGGGGGGNTPGKDANPDLSAGGVVIPGLSGSGRGAGVGSAGTDTGKGGPLTGSSSRGGQTGQNTGAYIGGTIVATSTGNAGMGGTAQGGTFGLGLGGDGGFPNGGASCDCVPGGGGGGGGGGYAPGGGGGYDADGTGGGGGGAGSLLSGGLSASYTGYNLGSINTGNGYLKISYQASTSAVLNLLNLTNTQPYVGGTYSAPTALSFAANDPGATSTWKWQILKNQGSQPGGSPDIVDIPGTTATTLVVPASASGYRIRPVQVVTMSNGDLFYFSGPYSYTIAGSHTITGAPADTFKGDTAYTYTFGLTGDYGATATSGWAKASGTLPPGTGLGTNGLFSGTPTTAGTYSFVVSHNNGYETATKSISVTIWPSVTFTSSFSKTCVWGDACTHQVVATPPAGETLTYSIDSGTVPAGMTFDAATATFSGTYNNNATFYVWVKASAPSGAYAIQKLSFFNTTKTQQGYFSNPTISNVTWNAANPPTASMSWTQPAPTTGLVHIDVLTPTICSAPTGFVTSPITMTALSVGVCTFDMVSDGDATYNPMRNFNRTWTINGTAQSLPTIAQVSGTLNWVDNNTTITVQASGGSGTGAYVYGTSTVATTCVVDPTTGVVTWLTSALCTVTAYRAKDANYAQSTTAWVSFTPINKAQVTPVTVTSDVSTIQYVSGGRFNVAGAGGDFAPGSAPAYFFYSLTPTVCSPQGGSYQINMLNAGTCQIYAKANASAAWLAGTVIGAATSITITGTAQASLSLVANAGNAITYTANGTINYVVSGGSGTGGWTVANDPSTASICTSSGTATTNSLTMKGAGTCLINVTKASQGGYYAATQQFPIAIGKATQSLISMTFSPTALTYNPTTPATFTVSGSGGTTTGAFVFSIDPSATSICSINGNTVTALGAGSCIVIGYRSGDANYADSTTASRTMAISKAVQSPVTITANRTTLTGSDTDPLVITGAGGSGTGAYVYATSTSTICAIDSATGVVTPKLNGNCSITATRAADANFLVSTSTAILNITVTKLAQASFVASSTTTSTTYGAGTFTVSTTGGSGTGATTYSSGNTAICTVVSTTGVTTIVTPGSCVITATKAADTNYLVATSSVTITIAKANQAAFTATLTNATATVGQVGVYAGGTGGTTGTGFDFSGNDAAICAPQGGGMILTYSAGSCVITVTLRGNIYYNDISSTITLQVNKGTQATFNLTPSRASGAYLDGASYSVAATGGSGTGAVSYASNSANICSVDSSSGVVTILSAGTCSITATKSGDGAYNDATKTATITIAKINQTALVVSADNTAIDYTENPWATAQVSFAGGSSTGASSFSTSTPGVCSVGATGLVTDITKGKCIVSVTVAADTNYNVATGSVSIRFGKVDQAAVTASTTRATVVYASGNSVTVSLTGGSGTGAISFATSSANCSVNASTGVVTYTGAGDCVVVATKAGDIDYAEASDSVTITVTKANQGTISATLNKTTTTFANGDSITASYTGGSGTGTVTYSTSSSACSVDSSTGAVSVALAGTCVVTVSITADANYQASSATVTLTIAKSAQATLNASPSSASVTFNDGTVNTVGTTGGSGTGAVTYASTTAGVCSVNSTSGIVTVITAGTCSITATKATDTNYLSTTGSTSITIAKATQATVTAAKNADTTYGSTTQIKVTGSGGSGTGAFSYSSTTTGICTINATTGVIAIVTAGDCVLTATKASDVNYNSAAGNVTITIAKANQAAATASATYSSVTFGDGSVNTVALSGGTGTGSTSFASTTAGVCSVNSTTGVITIITAGTCSITATKAADTNYNQATASVSVTINKATQAALTASSSSSNTTYGSGTAITVSTTGGSGTGSVTFSSNTSGVCSVNSTTGVITVITAGTCTVAAAKASDSSYNSTSNTVSVIIAKATQATLTMTPSQTTATFADGSTITVSVTGGSGTGAVTYLSNSTGICTVNASTGAVTVLTAGTCSITATKAADVNYNVATDIETITIAKANQATLSASGSQNITHTVAKTTAQITVTGGSGTGTVSYAVDASSAGVCTVSAGGLVTELHAGTCLINITKAGDTNYDAATTSFTITIAKANQAALTVGGNQNITYNATTTATSQLTVSGGAGTGSVTYSVNGSTVCGVSGQGLVTGLTGGSCVVTITKAGDGDFNERTATYTVTVAKAAQAALIVRTAATLTYDPSTPATTTVSVTTGGSGTGAITYSTTSTACSISGSTITALSAGSCVIKADKATDSRYLAATADYTIIIGKAAQTALTATASKTSLKVNDANDGTATVTLAGGSGTGATSWFVDPSTTGICSVNFSVTPAVVTALAGGTCLVNITKAGDANYLEATTSVSFTVIKNAQAALTVSSTKTTAIKGETATLSATGGSTAGNLSYSVVTGATVCSISGATVTFIGAGSCTVKATRAGDAGFDAVDSATITLSATKAEQSQLVVAQAAGMLANVAIGGKSATSWNLSGGNGDGSLSVSNVTGCYATIVGNVLTASAGAAAGSCVIDVAKDASENYNSTTYRISLSVFNLPGEAAIDTPALNLTNGPNGVGVDVPFTPSASGTFVAPVNGYQLQTKSGSNWVNADNGFATGASATKVSISVTPWTSIFVRVAAVSPYESDNGASRIWSTYGGATAQAFNVPGLITSLSISEISAKSADTITVNGAGYSQASTPSVTFTAAQAIFQVNGVSKASITIPASVKSANQLTFKYPGALLPAGVKTLAANVAVNGTNSMKSNTANMVLTSDDDSIDLGLDLNAGKFAPKISTVFAGTFTWAFKTTGSQKIFLVTSCLTYKTVKGVKTCSKTGLVDSATCSISQKLPINKSGLRRTVAFTTFCQLNNAGKLALLNTQTTAISATATFARAYPKTGLAYVLVKGKKTKVIAATKKTYIFNLGNKAVVRG